MVSFWVSLPLDYLKGEILISDEDTMGFFGSGQLETSKVIEEFPKYSALNILRKVILDGNVQTVGGSLQFGPFCGKNFDVSEIIENNPTYEDPDLSNFMLQGINHDRNEFEEIELRFLINVGLFWSGLS